MKNEQEISYMRRCLDHEWRLLRRVMAFPKYADMVPEAVRNIVTVSRILARLEQ